MNWKHMILYGIPVILLITFSTGCGYSSDDLIASRQRGYQNGYEIGYNKGYDEGYDKGFDDGYAFAAIVPPEPATSQIPPAPSHTPEPTPEPEPESEPEPEQEPELSASCRVKNWQQDYWDFLEEWSDIVEIYIEIENTGDLDIDYYEVYFIVECSGGNDYYGMVNGLDLEVGEEDTIWTIEMVNGNEVLDIEIDDWELEHY